MIPVKPSKIICVGRNYIAHAQELGNTVPPEPMIFLKPPSALLAPGEAIVLPGQSQQVEYEGEIGVVVLERLRNVSAAQAEKARLGFTCVNDVTARTCRRPMASGAARRASTPSALWGRPSSKGWTGARSPSRRG